MNARRDTARIFTLLDSGDRSFADLARSRQRPRVQRPADGRQDELAPVERVGHWRSSEVAAGIYVPHHLAGGGVDRDQPPRLVGEDEASRRREDSVAALRARSDPTP